MGTLARMARETVPHRADPVVLNPPTLDAARDAHGEAIDGRVLRVKGQRPLRMHQRLLVRQGMNGVTTWAVSRVWVRFSMRKTNLYSTPLGRRADLRADPCDAGLE
jgi:hypothetical protein